MLQLYCNVETGMYGPKCLSWKLEELCLEIFYWQEVVAHKLKSPNHQFQREMLKMKQ